MGNCNADHARHLCCHRCSPAQFDLSYFSMLTSCSQVQQVQQLEEFQKLEETPQFCQLLRCSWSSSLTTPETNITTLEEASHTNSVATQYFGTDVHSMTGGHALALEEHHSAEPSMELDPDLVGSSMISQTWLHDFHAMAAGPQDLLHCPCGIMTIDVMVRR